MFSTVAIAIVGVALLIATVIPGIRLYWPQRRDPVSRTDLGVALMTGAFIAFAVLGLQLLIQVRSQLDANDRQAAADRQALLLLLGRSPKLDGLDLHGQDLSRAYLNWKGLNGADLRGANMKSAQLEHAQLTAAKLQAAKLDAAHLDFADLRQANLAGASLVRANLSGAKLDAAVLSRRLEGGKLVAADLADADLSNAVARADFRHAILRGAHLVGTTLAPANLRGADLRGADLQFADLRGADLRGANLSGAQNLQYAKDLSMVKFDRTTRWPHKFLWIYTGRDRQTQWRDPNDCGLPLCFLPRTYATILDVPQGLSPLREKLQHAIDTRGCLPGWEVITRRSDIEAKTQDGRASLIVSASQPDGMDSRAWGRIFMSTHKQGVREIRSIKVGRRNAYAEQFMRVEKDLLPQRVAAVYFVRGPLVYNVLASALPPIFPEFERDFIKLFRALGVEGNLFPELRAEKSGCST
jgi:uncharacterized protein YjbI with pentapeptide repeats